MAPVFVRVEFGADRQRLVRLSDGRDYDTLISVIRRHNHGHNDAVYVKEGPISIQITNSIDLLHAIHQHEGDAPLTLTCRAAPSTKAAASDTKPPAGVVLGHDDHPGILEHKFAPDEPSPAIVPSAVVPPAVLARIGSGDVQGRDQIRIAFNELTPGLGDAFASLIDSMSPTKAALFMTVTMPFMARAAIQSGSAAPQIAGRGASRVTIPPGQLAAELARAVLDPASDLCRWLVLPLTMRADDQQRRRAHMILDYFCQVQQQQQDEMGQTDPGMVQIARCAYGDHRALTDQDLTGFDGVVWIPDGQNGFQIGDGSCSVQVWLLTCDLSLPGLLQDRTGPGRLHQHRLITHPDLIAVLPHVEPLDVGSSLLVSGIHQYWTWQAVQQHYIPIRSDRRLSQTVIWARIMADNGNPFRLPSIIEIVNILISILRSTPSGPYRIAIEPIPTGDPQMNFLVMTLAASIAGRRIVLVRSAAGTSVSLADVESIVPILARVTIGELWRCMKAMRPGSDSVFRQLAIKVAAHIPRSIRRPI